MVLAKYRIDIRVEPDGKVRKPPTSQYYDSREEMEKHWSKLRKAGFKTEVYLL